MRRALILLVMISAVSCTSIKRDYSIKEKYKIDDTAMKNWEKTFSTVIKGESELEDWYGADEPIKYLAQYQKLDRKQAMFLDSLKRKEIIDKEDAEEFDGILNRVVDKLPRKYYLKDENIKDVTGLVKYMVSQSMLKVQNPSNYIATNVATPEEWQEIVVLSKKDDLTEKERKKVRKLLNKFIKREQFYQPKSWYFVEISPRTVEINNIYNKKEKTKLEINNVNAKALYIAYREYLSKLEKWDD